jgi:aminoglycoside 6'-N-acetyltransferase
VSSTGAGAMSREPYQFRPMSKADLPLVRRWLAMPHVTEWWGEPDEQFGLVSEDLHEPAMDQYVVVSVDRPFAYLQCYDQSAWPDNGLGLHPPGTRGIDQFIGEPDMVGRGHGSAFIRAFIDRLLGAGTPRVLTDPDPENVRAVRAYEKAGFRKERLVDTPDGHALLMMRDNHEPARTQ